MKGYRTLALNILTAIVALSGIVPPEYQAYALLASGIANVGLRFLTDSPVGSAVPAIRSVVVPLLLVAAIGSSGCSATQGGGTSQISPAQQCALIQTLTTSAQTAVLFVKVKSQTARDAIDASMLGVSAGATNYCSAVQAGQDADALGAFLVGFNTALADLNARLRAARDAELASS